MTHADTKPATDWGYLLLAAAFFAVLSALLVVYGRMVLADANAPSLETHQQACLEDGGQVTVASGLLSSTYHRRQQDGTVLPL